MIIVGRNGRPLLMNRSAELIIKENDGISIASDGLRASTAQETIALRALIRAAMDLTGGDLPTSAPQGGTMAISRASLKRKLELLAVPAASSLCGLALTKSAAMVFVSDPERQEPANHLDVLRSLYELTGAEAETASLLVEGKTLKEIAERLHVTYETPRAHLKHIFQKTGTQRQAELIKLLLRSPAFLRRTPRH